MAADELAENSFFGDIHFVTLDENSGKLIIWIFDDYSGKFFNSETAEFFFCPVPANFDLPHPRDTDFIRN